MAEEPINVPGWMGVDFTTDAFLLGKKKEPKSSLAYNYRAKNGVRLGRGGFQPVLDIDSTATANDQYFKKAGVYFPPGSCAILPIITTSYEDTFCLASTDTVDQYAFTVEFWYRADYTAFNRTVCEIPVNFAGATTHFKIELFPQTAASPLSKTTYLRMYLALSDEADPEVISSENYVSRSEITTDGDWHHLAITRDETNPGGNVRMHIDGDATGVLMDPIVGTGDTRLPLSDSFATGLDGPAKYNYLKLGGDGISMCDFRIWSTDKTADIAADMYTEADTTDTDLVTYIPFNEGTGKYFTDSVGGARGYFHPQEPWVNDDDELVFTGYKCLAYPSLRGDWRVPTGETATDQNRGCEDAAYDGGILWDTVLGLETVFDYEDEGVHSGTAQMRIRLRQLKEGILCGRLGMCYDGTAEKYRLFFLDESNVITYMSDAVIDEDYVGEGNEFTITILYNGYSPSDEEDRCKIYVGTTDYAANPSGVDVWANGDEIGASGDDLFHDTTGTDASGGAIGGSVADPDYCIAFDLLFFRQWWDDYPGSTEAGFIADTYNTNVLGDEYKYMIKDVRGYVDFFDNEVVFLDDAATLFNFNVGYGLAYAVLPFHNRSDNYSMDGDDTYMLFNSDGTVFKQDVYVHRIVDWVAGDAARVQIWPDAEDVRPVDSTWSAWDDRRFFNGAIISNCVNYYDSETFKKNRLTRFIFSKRNDADPPLIRTFTKNEVHPTITDDSPLQSIEKAGTYEYKTRYLLLANDDRNEVLTQRSLKPRWCDGRVTPSSPPTIRGICRYTSEDEEVDKLLVAAWSSIWELDPDTGTITPMDWAWMDRNEDLPINFLATNNQLVAMDTKSAVKINYKGNWSRLGIEQAVDVELDSIDHQPAGGFGTGEKYAWVAQFYDTENDSYGGTIPVYTTENQGVEVIHADGLLYVDVIVRSCKDYNVDRCRIFRTEDYSGLGTGEAASMYLVNDTNNPKFLAEVAKFRDIWTDISDNKFLSTAYYGVDTIPKNCKGLAIGYNRMFAFGHEEGKSSLYWSLTSTLGFPKVDNTLDQYRIIVEEGGTTEGRALVEFSNTLFAFKNNAIFEVTQTGGGKFGVQLVYRGVGAVNQRSVVVAGNSIIFIDRSGIYQYQNGEPIMASVELADYFSEEIDQDALETKAFILHDKTEELVYAFAPSSSATYCDRCIVFDLRARTFTIDLIPYVTCGYIDDTIIYLGTPYGQVFKYDKSVYLDGVTEDYSGTGLVV